MDSVLKPGLRSRSFMIEKPFRRPCAAQLLRTHSGYRVRPVGRQDTGEGWNSWLEPTACLEIHSAFCDALEASLSSGLGARSGAPCTLGRFSDIRCTPFPSILARFEDNVRELTPIQPISDDSRPYSIFGQRFI